MKKLFTIIAAIMLTTGSFAQAPQKMSYQTVIRDASNTLISNTTVGIQISVLQGSASGTVVYVESHTPLTNANGLASLEIGAGTIITGTFSGIDWSAGPYFIKTETDPLGGTAYTISGTSELMSVPYALFSANGTPGAVGATGAAGINGTNGTNGLDGATGAAGTNGIDGTNGLDGATGAAGINGTNGTNGIDGATGAAGTNGIDGTNGLNGATGPAGTNGLDGATGATGAAGTNGIDGATGAAGTNGIDGATGAAGTNGIDGTNGLTGATGAAGTNGTNGTNGLDGATGAAGTNGTNGTNGLNGATGATGAAGTNGLNGATGSTGADSNVQGPAGYSCWDTNQNGINDPTEDVDVNGVWNVNDCNAGVAVPGPAGPMGPTGAAGTNGLAGATGSMGPQGLDGAIGPMGPQGPQGLDGAVGPMGPQGPQGLDGAVGPMGPQGPQGLTGITGANGLQGPVGPMGPQGSQGFDGAVGPMGPQGPQGLTGITGATGMNGANGLNGATGATGIDGATGLTGVTGATGADGALNAWGLAGNAVTDTAFNFVGTRDATDLIFKTNATENMRITSGGKIGIGTKTPPAKLVVLAPGLNPTVPGAVSTGIFRLGTTDWAGDFDSFDFGKMSADPFCAWMQAGYAGTVTDPLALQPLGGNVGIGTGIVAPAAKLDIVGNVKITDGTQGAGKVLTSDATGIASWQTPASTAPVFLTKSANYVITNADATGELYIVLTGAVVTEFTLPSAAAVGAGKKVFIMVASNASLINVVTAGTDTLFGTYTPAGTTNFFTSLAYNPISISLVSDGIGTWYVTMVL